MYWVVLTTTIHKMELTTPSDLQPPTHPPTAMLERVTAGHLHVHMTNSGLFPTFLGLKLIYKSARTVSDLHISLYLWTLSACVSVSTLTTITTTMYIRGYFVFCRNDGAVIQFCVLQII